MAGVRRLRLEEVRLHQPAEEELTRAGLEEEEQVAAEFRAARAASAVEEEPIGLMALEPREPGTTTPVTYEQYDEWKRTATDTTEIVEVPGDKEQLKTPEVGPGAGGAGDSTQRGGDSVEGGGGGGGGWGLDATG